MNPMPRIRPSERPDVSFVMPCFNAEEVIGFAIPRLLSAFATSGYRLELVAVDNGSTDHTGEILQRLAGLNPGMICEHVARYEGYGYGVLRGLPLCSAPWVGIIPADGQVDADDVVRLYEAARATNGQVLAKVRRRFRLDGWHRLVIAMAFNALIRLLWPRLGSVDVNGNPKLLPRGVVRAMRLQSRGWFLDAEIMIKAYYLGVRVLEFNVFSRMQGSDRPPVRLGNCWQCLRRLVGYRFSQELSGWKQETKQDSLPAGDGREGRPALEVQESAAAAGLGLPWH